MATEKRRRASEGEVKGSQVEGEWQVKNNEGYDEA